jgi:uncharacterized protein YgiM (DUF1202 family)
MTHVSQAPWLPLRAALFALALTLAPALSGLGGVAALAQADARAQPVTGPGVVTIGGVGVGGKVNVRSGPTVLFPVVAKLGYGTRVEQGICLGGGSGRWCEITTMDGKTTGYVAARFLVEGDTTLPDDDSAGGPDYWKVRGLASNERLGVRLDPRAGAAVLATLQNGEIVRNLGCRMVGSNRWCQIRSTTGVDVTGWVLGSYLRESQAPSGSGGGGSGSGSGGATSDYLVVKGLASGDSLNLRSRASTQGEVIARLSEGTRVRNLGCETSGNSTWCKVRTSGAVEVTGWASARYLRND